MATSWPIFSEPGPKVSAADVAEFESRHNAQLPEDYRRFLLDVNGGGTTEVACNFGQGILNGMLSLNDVDREFNDLDAWNDRVRRDLKTGELIVIGYDDGGARILLAVAGERRGQVWMQLTDDARPEDANPRVLWHDRRDFKKLANSLSDFMASLRPIS